MASTDRRTAVTQIGAPTTGDSSCLNTILSKNLGVEAAIMESTKTAADAAAAEDYLAWRRRMVVIDSYSWVGSYLGFQNPTFTWEGKLVGEGRIAVGSGVLRKAVALKGIADDLHKIVLTADLFRGPYLEIERNKNGKFVLPKGFDLSPALYRSR